MDSITMTAEQQLPEGWKETTLGAEFEWSSGGTPKSGVPAYYENGSIHWLNISDLNDGLISYAEKKITELGLQESSAKIVPQGSVLIAIYGSIGKLGINTIPLATNQAICFTKKIPEYILNKFLFYYLLSIRNQLISMGKGGTQQNISQTVLKSVPFFYPTSKETQQAIVNKIESLFDEIDEGIGRLKTAARQIQQYRQSLLKNAFNGELTKEWRSKHADTLPSENELLAQIQTTREQHHAQQLADWQTAVSQWEQNGKEGKKPSKPKAPTQAVKFEENFADLPKGWGTIKINQVAEIFTGATPLKSNANYYENGSIPWVTSGSLNNEFVDSADSFVTDLALKETNLKLLPKHTLLVAMYGEGKTRGKCSELLIEATTNQAIAGIVLNDRYPISRKFLKFYMFKNYADIRRQSSGGVQPNLNLGLVGNIIFPLPCLAEQTQIVAILESKLTACDQLADELAKQLKQAELLKQAVLKVAFSGGLLDK
jgi:hypothetical protein